MSELALSPGWFHIAELSGSPQLRDELLGLQERQTRDLIVDGLRGWWERTGGEAPEYAMMRPSLRTLGTLPERQIDHDRPPLVERPNDAEDLGSFFRPTAPFASASPEEQEEAARKLLALSEMGWRSTSRWYGDRDELHER